MFAIRNIYIHAKQTGEIMQEVNGVIIVETIFSNQNLGDVLMVVVVIKKLVIDYEFIWAVTFC